MRLIASLIAAAAAAVLFAAPGPSGALAAKPTRPALTQHVVATRLVVAVEETRRAVWACQRGLAVPASRAGLDHAGLRASGWRFLVWANHRWHVRLAGCNTEATSRGRIVARVRAGLRGYPLEAWAARFEQAGRRWNVSPYLMAAIAGQESTFGLYVTPGNAWGIGPGKYFSDFGAGIDYLAEMLATRYNLSSLDSIGGAYCPGCGEWPGKVGWFLSSSFGQSPYALRYPALE